jgi:3-deoxy-D-manno-octulosonate 8-phosphate phosphatase (KDO 8-P phosphatase)
VKTPARASRIRLLVLDVDGVLTDGVLVYGPSGEETKRFHVRDGLAMQAARRAGIEVAIVSGRASAAVTRRMSELGIVEVHQGISDKAWDGSPSRPTRPP